MNCDAAKLYEMLPGNLVYYSYFVLFCSYFFLQAFVIFLVVFSGFSGQQTKSDSESEHMRRFVSQAYMFLWLSSYHEELAYMLTLGLC
jgi:hypothetical protein